MVSVSYSFGSKTHFPKSALGKSEASYTTLLNSALPPLTLFWFQDIRLINNMAQRHQATRRVSIRTTILHPTNVTSITTQFTKKKVIGVYNYRFFQCRICSGNSRVRVRWKVLSLTMKDCDFQLKNDCIFYIISLDFTHLVRHFGNISISSRKWECGRLWK